MTALVSMETLEQRPEKIHRRHLERTAAVYMSSMHQVQRNQESTKIQYGLVRLAQELGWDPDRITVIDEDLGMSAASAAGRAEFQHLLAEVALDHVGLIVGVEMSRLARSNKDWHQLLELCARFGTLIADLDGLYDPSHYNDIAAGVEGNDVGGGASHPAPAFASRKAPQGSARRAGRPGADGLSPAALWRDDPGPG